MTVTAEKQALSKLTQTAQPPTTTGMVEKLGVIGNKISNFMLLFYYATN